MVAGAYGRLLIASSGHRPLVIKYDLKEEAMSIIVIDNDGYTLPRLWFIFPCILSDRFDELGNVTIFSIDEHEIINDLLADRTTAGALLVLHNHGVDRIYQNGSLETLTQIGTPKR